jgi:hypothetical protein
MVILSPGPLYLHGKIPHYQINRRLGGPTVAQSRFRAFREGKPLVVIRNRTKTPQMSKPLQSSPYRMTYPGSIHILKKMKFFEPFLRS